MEKDVVDSQKEIEKFHNKESCSNWSQIRNDPIYSIEVYVFCVVCFSMFYQEQTVKLIGRQDALGGVFPPEDIELIPPFGIPLLNTFILSSGGTITWAHHALREGDRKNFYDFLFLTIILGIVFTGFQAYEYKHATFSIDEGIYASTFYMATGFHGAHVIMSTLFLIVCFIRGLTGHLVRSILVSNSRHGTGISLMLYGFSYSLLFIGGLGLTNNELRFKSELL